MDAPILRKIHRIGAEQMKIVESMELTVCTT